MLDIDISNGNRMLIPQTVYAQFSFKEEKVMHSRAVFHEDF